MLIVTIRTDKPEAEIGLYDDATQLAYKTWQAHRQLAETIHLELQTLLTDAGKSQDGIDGIVCYQGPGSFTGLRIGLTVANALAYGLNVPIVGGGNDDWRTQAISRLLRGETDGVALPEYGADANITLPKTQPTAK